jgi:hypothetical protein
MMAYVKRRESLLAALKVVKLEKPTVARTGGRKDA